MARVIKDDILQSLGFLTGQAHVADIAISGDSVTLLLEIDPAKGAEMETLRQSAERAVAALSGVKKATAIMTAEKKGATSDPHGMNKNPPLTLPIKKIIAVGSGKGGVGKSTVAFNLALALARAGKKVGLLDADVYGPSVPKLAGLEGKKPEQKNDKIIPFTVHGVKIMSIGFMVEADQALIWRGPMAQSALYQMLRDVEWGDERNPLDVLIIDLPPGTGDIQLTLVQKVPVSGAVIVSTPQDLALIDARKAVAMFEKVGVPVLGIVENMSVYVCPNCGYEDHIFGHGGAAAEAKQRGIPFLGEIPLTMTIRAAGDAGKPADSPIFQGIAQKIIDII